MAANSMAPRNRKSADRRDLWLASVVIAAGLAMSGVSAIELAFGKSDNPQMAQATQPLQSSPSTSSDKPAESKPAESKPGGERPTTPAPEPARPDAEAQKAGATPVLPSAPAEKTAAPIQSK